ncbi:hypothetical protein GCM10025777_18610 [Membranihabitans marinus]
MTTSISAQKLDRRVSLSAGGLYSYLTEYEKSRILGYEVGLYTDLIRRSKWGLSTGLEYHNKGGENGVPIPNYDVTFKYRYHQITLPVLASYNLTKRLSIYGGLYIGMNKTSVLEYGINEWFITPGTVVSIPGYTEEAEFRKLELGSRLGVQLQLFDNWYIGFFANHSFSTFYNNNADKKNLLLFDKDYYTFDDEFKKMMDKKLVSSKNMFYSLVLRRNLFKD